MIIYSTKIPVTDTFQKEKFVEIVLKWNQGSKYDKFENALWDGHTYCLKFTDEIKKMEIEDFQDYGIIASRLQKEDEYGLWTTEFVLNYAEHTLAICLSRVTTELTTNFLPSYYPPYFVKMLVWSNYAAIDNGIQVSNMAIESKELDCHWIANIFNKNFEYCLPIIYVTKNIDGTYPLDADNLAFRMQAIAHVVKETNCNLNEMVDEKNKRKLIKAGRVYLFYPNRFAKEKTFNMKGDCIVTHLEDRIVSAVYTFMNSQVRDQLDSWDGIQNQRLQIRNNKLITEHQSIQDENKNLYDLFDEQLKDNEECINNLNREVQILRQENQGLRMKLASLQSIPLINYGEESDFYEGEIREIIMDIMQGYLKNYKDNTRRAHIVQDLLENNEYQHYPEQRREQLKNILKGYKTLNGSLRRNIEDLGFVITEDGKHYKWTYYGDHRYVETVAKTCSDGRAGLNIAASIEKLMF